MGKKKKAVGFVVPKQIAYALVLAILGTAFTSYGQLQAVDQRLRIIEAEINALSGIK